MTPEPQPGPLSLPFDPDLAEQCALKMGWVKEIDKDSGDWFWLDATGHTACNLDICINYTPPFSTDIAAAWQLVEKARLMVTPMRDGRYFAGVIGYERPGPGLDEGAIDCYFEDGWVIADTAPEAICLAFLALDL